MGKGKGIKQLAQKVGATYLPNIKTNEYGTPLLDDAFSQARAHSSSKILMYSNADMIYDPGLLDWIKLLPQSNFLAVGSRWDLDIRTKLVFNSNWWGKLNQLRVSQGHPHAPVGSDYFIFSRHDFTQIPGFAVGRVKWDNWMIYEAKRLRLRTIDCSSSIVAIHQNHDYSHQLNKGVNYLNGPEAKYNESLAKSVWRPFTLLDANWILTKKGIIKKTYALSDYQKLLKDILYGIMETIRKYV